LHRLPEVSAWFRRLLKEDGNHNLLRVHDQIVGAVCDALRICALDVDDQFELIGMIVPHEQDAYWHRGRIGGYLDRDTPVRGALLSKEVQSGLAVLIETLATRELERTMAALVRWLDLEGQGRELDDRGTRSATLQGVAAVSLYYLRGLVCRDDLGFL
jgi:hypothetical protein